MSKVSQLNTHSKTNNIWLSLPLIIFSYLTFLNLANVRNVLKVLITIGQLNTYQLLDTSFEN